MSDAQEILELRKELNQANFEYYVKDDPTMSDYDYDHKLRRLEELEGAHPELVTPDSPTQRWVARPWSPSPRSPTGCLWSPSRTCSTLTSCAPLTSGCGEWSPR